MKENKYSVLMSVYKNDCSQYTQLAIDSMLNQTIPPEQIVVVKDGPIDSDLNICLEQYSARYGTLFTIISLDENKGLANALNMGMKSCRNNLVARMDADDISLPERCERELELFDQYPNLVACGCNIDEFFGNPTDIKTSRTVPCTYEEIIKFSKRRQPFNHPTVMYRKDEIDKIGGYHELKRKEDFDLFSRLIATGKFVLNVNESLYLYRANEQNYMRRKSLLNFSSAMNVYIQHWKRKGCSFVDLVVIIIAELIFLLAPIKIMKFLSDRFLRVKT